MYAVSTKIVILVLQFGLQITKSTIVIFVILGYCA